MGFLKSLFSKKEKALDTVKLTSEARVPPPSVESMSLTQIIEYIPTFEGSIPSSTTLNIHRRLYEIALYDHHVEQNDRLRAYQIMEALSEDLKAVNSHNPEYLAAIAEAAKHMESNARIFGVGSLAWLIKEHDVPPEKVEAFVMQPEYGYLLSNFITAIGPEIFATVKAGLVRNLILSRRYGSCTNAVLTLHGLATKGDKATVALFNEAELSVLVGIPDDYVAGRQLLVNLGLLPSESSALPFVPIADKSRLIQLMAEVHKERDGEAKADDRVTSTSGDRQDVLLVALSIQRLHLIRRMVGQIHGEVMAQALLEVLSEGLARDTAKRFDGILSVLDNAPAGTPIDFMLLDQVISMSTISIVTEDEFERERPWLEMGSDWLNTERVEVLDYTRYLLRWDPDNMPPQAKTAADESIASFIFKTYLEQGAKAGFAEKTMPNLEDWIGVSTG
jgi:hypothetical protein